MVGRTFAAIAAIKSAVVRICPAVVEGSSNAEERAGPRIRDAVRPRVVRADGHAARRPALDRKQHAVVAGGTARFLVNHVAVVLADGGILQTELTALI